MGVKSEQEIQKAKERSLNTLNALYKQIADTAEGVVRFDGGADGRVRGVHAVDIAELVEHIDLQLLGIMVDRVLIRD